MPRISVIVPVYNTAATLPACIESLMALDLYDIIMVDNNSTDSSVEIIRGYPKIALLSEGKQGAYAVRNTGIRHSKSDILAFTDSDCAVASDWLEQVLASLEPPESCILIGQLFPVTDSSTLTILASHRKSCCEFIFNSDINALYFGQGGDMAVKRRVFEKMGLFAEKMRGSDSLLVQQSVARDGTTGVVYNSSAVVYRFDWKSVLTVLKKQIPYGSTGFVQRIELGRRWLNHTEQKEVMQRTIKQNRYTWREKLVLSVMLWLVGMSSKIGGFSARCESILSRRMDDDG